MTRYSQNDEQDVILKHFDGRTGNFLDIGAYDGVTFSNTRALLELGWTGTLVEPNPFNSVKLIESVRQFGDKAHVACAALGRGDSPILPLRIDETKDRGWASTLVQNNPQVLAPHPVSVWIPVVNPYVLWFLGPFHFISIDTEWMDTEILLECPDDLPHCELICIEPRGPEEREEMKTLLHSKFNFACIHETKENILAYRMPKRRKDRK